MDIRALLADSQERVKLYENHARVLEAMALQADRYDAELAEIRDDVLALSNRIEAVARERLHSVRVEP